MSLKEHLAELHWKAVHMEAVAEAMEAILERGVDQKVVAGLASALVGLLREIQLGLDVVNLPKETDK